MVDFNSIPNGILTPGAFVENDPSGAVEGDSAKPQHVLALAVVPTVIDGTGSHLVPTPLTSTSQVMDVFGKSELSAVMCSFMRKNPRTKISGVAIAEAGAGTAATATITFTGAATEDWTIYVRFNGMEFAVKINSGDAVADAAAAVVTAFDAAAAKSTTPWMWLATANSALGVVTLTAVWKGTTSNGLSLALNVDPKQRMPAGLSAVVADFSGGASDPDIATAIAVLGGTHYTRIVNSLSDAANMGKLELEAESRWDGTDDRDVGIFVAIQDTHAATITWADTRNSPYVVAMASGKSPTPPQVWAAQACAADVLVSNILVVKPRFGQLLPDCILPANQFTRDERQLLLEAGIATHKSDAAGRAIIESLVTTYTKDPATDTPDTSYQDWSLVDALGYLNWSWLTRASQRFAAKNAANDGTRVASGSNVVTPSTLRGELVAWAGEMEEAGIIEDAKAYADSVITERAAGDPSRMNILDEPNIINELKVIAKRTAFKR